MSSSPLRTFTPISVARVLCAKRFASDRVPLDSGGFEWIRVRCEACGFHWDAPPGEPKNGAFRFTASAVLVGCPLCKAEGAMNPDLAAAAAGG